MVNFFDDRLKKFNCARKVYPDKMFSDNTLSNKLDIAIVIPTITGECATHRDCSHFFYTCLRLYVGSSRFGEFLNVSG